VQQHVERVADEVVAAQHVGVERAQLLQEQRQQRALVGAELQRSVAAARALVSARHERLEVGRQHVLVELAHERERRVVLLGVRRGLLGAHAAVHHRRERYHLVVLALLIIHRA